MPTREIPLSSRKYPGLVALIDEADYELVGQFQWRPSVCGESLVYARANPNTEAGQGSVLLHRLLLGLTGDSSRNLVGDHINRDGLDNRRSNLRTCEQSSNLWNRRSNQRGSSKFKGVHWHATKWCVQISCNNKRLHLGSFDNEVIAALAYDAAARELHGEFARLNFPLESERAA